MPFVSHICDKKNFAIWKKLAKNCQKSAVCGEIGEADERCQWQMKRGGLWRTECDRSQCEKKGALLSEEIQSLARRFIDEARGQYF